MLFQMKRLFLYILLMFFCTCIFAQDYTRYSVDEQSYACIVRSCPAYYLYLEACYTKDAYSGYIELRHRNFTAGRISVPLGYDVRDMKVYKNLLYFCGRHKHCGFIAVANLHDIFSYINPTPGAPLNAAVSYADLCVGDIESLEKIVVYPEQSNMFPLGDANEYVAAIGKSGSQWKALSIKYQNLYLGPSSIFSPGTIFVNVLYETTGTYNDRLEEVLLTEDYVAFVSYRYATEEYIIHRCDKYNLLGTYNTIYKYHAPQNEALSRITGVAMDANYIALASLAEEPVGASTFEIRIRNIDLSTMNMVGSQGIDIMEQKRDVELAYNPVTKTIIMMMYFRLYGETVDNHSFFQVDEWPTYYGYYPHYSIPAIYDMVPTHYASHDNSIGSWFVAVSGNTWFHKNISTYAPVPDQCYKGFFLLSYQRTDLEQIIDETAVSNLQDKLYVGKQDCPIESLETKRECNVEVYRNRNEE